MEAKARTKIREAKIRLPWEQRQSLKKGTMMKANRTDAQSKIKESLLLSKIVIVITTRCNIKMKKKKTNLQGEKEQAT